MTIKCPFCLEELNPIVLSAHIMDKHSKIELSLKYGELYVRIHEIIAEVEHSRDYNRDVKKYDVDCEEWTLEKLKSLLENDK